ncbi:helix-turn-helix domain-containing protein [Aliagarivorans taiwanensis]|uniref:helix-turn-helix domain-containing protein n=1 Tax=Aliagarivorans taiwanensis TaxID=561966 RepID=UPI000402EFDC|nr:helix-turn-helix transcriptional regulator [Aliagarivorans taiwanensis]
MSDLAKQIGLRLREKRMAAQVSQEGLANLADVDRSYVGRIERGEVNVTIDVLYKLSEVIGCDPKTLLP